MKLIYKINLTIKYYLIIKIFPSDMTAIKIFGYSASIVFTI